MGAAAQFDAVGAVVLDPHRQDADLVAIFLAEQRHRALGDRLVRAHQAGRDRLVVADVRIHLGLDRGDVVGAERAVVREVEAEAVGRDQAALLRHVRAEPVAQRGVEQVGRAMIGADRAAALLVDLLGQRVADLERALADLGTKQVKLANLLRSIVNVSLEAIER